LVLVVGLYFAGDEPGTVGVANPIAAVLNALDVHMGVAKAFEIKKDHEIKKLEHEIKKQEHDIKKIEKEQDITKGYEPITKGNEPITKGYEPITKGNEPITKGNEPISTGPGMAQPVGSLVEERLARLEMALAQLTHFIQSGARPNLDQIPLQNEGDIGRSE
jgi:hypothetical protein